MVGGKTARLIYDIETPFVKTGVKFIQYYIII